MHDAVYFISCRSVTIQFYLSILVVMWAYIKNIITFTACTPTSYHRHRKYTSWLVLNEVL